MAHPYASSKEQVVSRKRAGGFVKGLKRGGSAKHEDLKADKKLFSGLMKDHEASMHGKARGGRLDKFARGGRAKKHGTQVNIAVVAPHGRHPADAGALPGGPAGSPPPRPPLGAAPPGLPPGGAPMGPPGLPPGGPPPGMMQRGGKVQKRAMGGKVKMRGGGDTGVGRLDKVKAYGLKPIKGSS